jgi:hypothetical protein
MLCWESLRLYIFVDDHYTIQSYISVYGMISCLLPDELEWTDYIRPQVEVDLSIWKLGHGW